MEIVVKALRLSLADFFVVDSDVFCNWALTAYFIFLIFHSLFYKYKIFHRAA